MIVINQHITLDHSEVDLQAIRSQGAGGQNVNKVATAIHLRFDIHASSLPDIYKQRLLRYRDQRITSDGQIIIKAQEHRSQVNNRQEAIERLCELIRHATRQQKNRRPTRPGKAAKERRLKKKNQRGQLKQKRKKVDF